jgi:hypothetical protein
VEFRSFRLTVFGARVSFPIYVSDARFDARFDVVSDAVSVAFGLKNHGTNYGADAFRCR